MLGEYSDFRCIGAGAMGVVFEAHHRPLERKVAVKILSPSVLSNRNTVERFFREARAMAKLRHGNIVQVFEVGGEGKIPYFTMALLSGGSLKDSIMNQGPMPPRAATKIARDIAEALEHSHDSSILHRDIKPGNVLLDEEGAAHLTDFGLVRRTDSVTLTASDAIVGTPQYMSPEQVRGDKLDGRSDQFALGSTLYEMLTGEAPFQGDSPVSVLRAICDVQPRSLRKVRPELPSSLEAIVMRMLEKDPDRRYGSMQQVRNDLDRYLRGEAVEATLPGPLTRSYRRLRNNKLASRFAATTLALVVIAGFYFYNNWKTRGEQDRNQVLQQISTAIKDNDTEKAQFLLEGLPAARLEEPAFLSLRVNLAKQQKDSGLALFLAEELVTKTPNDINARYTLADLYVENDLYDEAKLQLNRIDRLENREIEPETGEVIKREMSRKLNLRFVDLFWRWAHSDVMESMEFRERLTSNLFSMDNRNRNIMRGHLNRLERLSTLYISNGRSYLTVYFENQGRNQNDLEYRTYGAFFQALEALMTDASQELLAANKAMSGVMELQSIGVDQHLAKLEYGTKLSIRIQESTEILDEDERRAAADLQARYEIMSQAAQSAIELTRREVQKNVSDVEAPESKPVMGPLGRAQNLVGGLVRGIFGSGENEEEPEPTE